MRLPFTFAALSLVTAAACSSDPDPVPANPTTASSSGSGGAGAGGAGGEGGTGGTGGTGGLPPSQDIVGEITRYDYAFNLDTLTARARFTVDVAQPGGDCFATSYDLDTIGGVTFGGAPATSVAIAGGQLRTCGLAVSGGESLEIGADVTVPDKNYIGLDVGFDTSVDMDGGTFSYLLSWVGGCDHFGPCDDDPSKLTEFHFEVTHSPDDVVLCPGTLTTEPGVTRCDIVSTLAPTYSAFAIASDPLWVRAPYPTIDGVDLVFYEVPSGELASTLEPPSVAAFFQWVTGLLGPLPYGSELRVAGAPTYWLGFEHPANIILNEGLSGANTSYENTLMHVFMHEVVHQWAGDRTTLASAADFVWKEATAEYLSYVFEDEQRPPVEAASSLAYWDAISLQSEHYPRPTDEPMPEVQDFYGDVYGPGPMVLYVQLETLLGRDVVLQGIQTFLAASGARAVTDLQASLEAAAGVDLTAYFDAWVFGVGAPEWPTLQVTTAQVGDQVTVTVTQQNTSGKLYGCLVEVEVSGATQTATALVDFGVAPTGATATATVTLAEPVASATLDPNHRLVARQSSNVTALAGPKLPVWIF